MFRRGDPPNATYTFKHALVQETAYNALLRPRREEIHGRIARTLASDFPEVMEANPELIADHYTEAGLDEEAVEFWREAGDLAVARSAPKEAIAHLGQALALLKRFPASPHRSRTELGLQTTLGAALIAARGFAAPEVGEAYARAQQLCEELGDDARRFPALFGRWIFLTARAEMAEALAVADAMLQLAGEGAPVSGRQRAAADRAPRAHQHLVLPRRFCEGTRPCRNGARRLRAGPPRRARDPVLGRSLRGERLLPRAQPGADGPSRAGAAMGACRARPGARAGARRDAGPRPAPCLRVPPAVPRARGPRTARGRADRARRRARPRLLAGARPRVSWQPSAGSRASGRRARGAWRRHRRLPRHERPPVPALRAGAAGRSLPPERRSRRRPAGDRRGPRAGRGDAACAASSPMCSASRRRCCATRAPMRRWSSRPWSARSRSRKSRRRGSRSCAPRSSSPASGRARAASADARARLQPLYAWFTEGLHSADLRAAKTLLDDLG